VLQEAELSGQADSENDLGGSSQTMYFIGLDVHKKTISFCVKTRLAMFTRKAGSGRHAAIWTAGSGPCHNPG
jgi:hypothetical protein